MKIISHLIVLYHNIYSNNYFISSDLSIEHVRKKMTSLVMLHTGLSGSYEIVVTCIISKLVVLTIYSETHFR